MSNIKINLSAEVIEELEGCEGLKLWDMDDEYALWIEKCDVSRNRVLMSSDEGSSTFEITFEQLHENLETTWTWFN